MINKLILDDFAFGPKIDSHSVFSYRPIIVWAINDLLEEKEIKTQLADFKKCGYGGVMVMPWGGLPYDFMSVEWVDAVDFMLACAKEIGLDFWIWDDWCFSSGFAGGVLAKKNPEYRASSLKILLDVFIEPGENFEFILPARALAASVFNIDKFGNPIGENRENIGISANKKITLHSENRQRIVVVGWEYISGMHYTTKSHGSFLDNCLSDDEIGVRIWDDREAWGVDLLNPAATREYLRLIHERYYERSSRHFGDSLKGFFFDEPKLPTKRPWTKDFAERFRAIKGYDILDYLPAILLDYQMDSGNFNNYFRPHTVKKAEVDYSDAWTTFLAESFYQIVGSWCKEHRVISGGHPIGDGSVGEHKELFCGGGVYRKNMALSELPGIDTVWGIIEPGRFVDNPRFAGSIATANGLGRALSESFAVWGHGIDLDTMRYVCEHQIVRGVNTFFCKLSNYNREKSLHFHPPELSCYNPIIRHFGSVFCDRIENISRLLNSGKAVSRAALFIELENYYLGDVELPEFLGKIAEKLTYEQIEYDYLYAKDILSLKRNSSLILNQHGQAYHAIIIPEGSRLSPEVSSICKVLGNRILFVNKNNIDQTLTALKQKNDLPYTVVTSGSQISSLTRILKPGVYCTMLLNESNKISALSVRINDESTVFEIDANLFTVDSLVAITTDRNFNLKFVPGESKFLIFDSSNYFKTPNEQSVNCDRGQLINGWKLQTPDGKVLSLDEMLSDWAQLGFSEYTGFMRYSAEFFRENDGNAVLSLGELRYAATVFLDGRKIQDCLFSPFEVKLGKISKGKHLLEIDVLNTMANSIYGDQIKLKALHSSGVFNGTYAEFYEGRDLLKLKSGLLGPVIIYWEKWNNL